MSSGQWWQLSCTYQYQVSITCLLLLPGWERGLLRRLAEPRPLGHAATQLQRTFVMPRTTSMDVTKAFDEPVNSHPTTSGKVRETGSPSMTASVSMPPTPGRQKWAHQHSTHEHDGVPVRSGCFMSSFYSFAHWAVDMAPESSHKNDSTHMVKKLDSDLCITFSKHLVFIMLSTGLHSRYSMNRTQLGPRAKKWSWQPPRKRAWRCQCNSRGRAGHVRAQPTRHKWPVIKTLWPKAKEAPEWGALYTKMQVNLGSYQRPGEATEDYKRRVTASPSQMSSASL